MIKEALKYLVNMGGIHKESLIDGSQYITSGEDYRIVKMPVLEPISCNTLTGIVDFINMDDVHTVEDRILLPPLAIHIKSHSHIELIGDLDNFWRTKKVWVESTVEVHDMTNVLFSLEDSLPWMQSFFVQDLEVSYVLDNLSKITASNGIKVTDKGISLAVESKKDMHFKENDEVRSQVTLRPYRTFREIEQPESRFVLRVKEDNGNISVLMQKTTDPNWKIRAIESIKEFFQERITDSSISIIA